MTTANPTPDRVTAIYDAIDAFQRKHKTSGLQHAQIRALLAEHLNEALPAAPDAETLPVELHRLSLSDALDLGTGAPWDAIYGRIVELRHLPDADPAPAVVPPADQTAMAPAVETDEERADREETARDHARGDHTYCGITCEAEMPTEHLRNFLIAKGYPGTKGALDELLRRARAAVLPVSVDRGTVLREAAARYEAMLAAADTAADPRYWTAVRDMTLGLRRLADEAQPDTETRCGCPNEDVVDHQFGTDDCTCIPFTRQETPPRYLNRPTDTVDMISGWERGRDCPHHGPAVVAQPAHLGGGANAEDCPACCADGLHKLAYPWACPGPDTSEEPDRG